MKLTKYWQKGLRIGIILFVISMVAAVIFWNNSYDGYCKIDFLNDQFAPCTKPEYLQGLVDPFGLIAAFFTLLGFVIPATFIGWLIDIYKKNTNDFQTPRETPETK